MPDPQNEGASQSEQDQASDIVRKGRTPIPLSMADVNEPKERQVRFTRLCGFVVVGWLIGCVFLRFWVDLHGSWLNRAAILSAVVVVLVAAPFIVFLTKQWYVRRNEFRNRLSDGALLCYLERYWWRRASSKRIDFSEALDETGEVLPEIKACLETQKKADQLFLELYDEQYGIRAFVIPFSLVLLATFASAAIVSWLWGCPFEHPKNPERCMVFGANPNLATAAIAGAYMFAVGDAVNSVRQNSLNIADVYWYALRLVIAIPLGVAVGNASGSTGDVHTLYAFGLGALPVDEIQKLLRRLTMGSMQAGDARQEPDQLLSLEGVTVRTSTLLVAEGISSISQVESKDPVLLAVRTGLEFDFILYLASQAVVRRHLGVSASALVPLGLIEAQAIRKLVQSLDDPDADRNARALATLKDAADRIRFAANTDRTITAPCDATVRTTFEQIAEAPVTTFLSHVAPRGYLIRENMGGVVATN
jgi:hypothetical protein